MTHHHQVVYSVARTGSTLGPVSPTTVRSHGHPVKSVAQESSSLWKTVQRSDSSIHARHHEFGVGSELVYDLHVHNPGLFGKASVDNE